MRYKPEDAEPQNLLPERWYDATLTAEENVSKKGNDQIVVTSRVYHDGQPFDMKTYFVAVHKSSVNRFKKFCAILGINFDAGEVTPEMINGKACKVEVKTEKSDDPKWDDKSVVAYFAAADSTPPNDDEIPF